MQIPEEYRWLEKITLPPLVAEALKELGTLEGPGIKDNPKILDWAKELSLERQYSNDSIPWCGLFMGVIAKRAGFQPVKGMLWAKNWAGFGDKVMIARIGDIVVINRPGGGGHVFVVIGQDATSYHGIGGNQKDSVCFSRFEKNRVYAVRRPVYENGVEYPILQVLSKTGTSVSTNEA